MNEIEQRKQLMKIWGDLPEPRVSWEDFKRLASRKCSMDITVKQAIKLGRKLHDNQTTTTRDLEQI